MSSVRGQKVLLAMSGGVDSSVSAVLLKEAGYDVVGCFMRLGSPGETIDELIPGDQADACDPRKVKLGHQGCCSVSDAADARQVAAMLGIPFYVCNFKKDFARIMDYFADEYASGRTPNPCVRCNDWLKFGKLHEYAKQIDAEFVASGHYARIESRGDELSLCRGRDHDKDQSYVLFGGPCESLSKMMLPVGGLRKSEVRAIAERAKLPVFNKPDSQEICFVPDNDYAGFVDRRRPGIRSEGAIVDPEGKRVGTHAGQHRFTIGQRRGVGVALGYPIFVVDKDPVSNTVTVGPREMLMSSRCVAGEANWLIDERDLGAWTECYAKYRYNTDAVRARVRVAEASHADVANYSGRVGAFEVEFETPQEAVTPGQAIVIYASDNDRVLGGGWIASVG
jgi:tRNA-specific 2-thiouridylase